MHIRRALAHVFEEQIIRRCRHRVAGLVLLAGGGGAAWFFLGQKPATPPASTPIPTQTASIPAMPEPVKPLEPLAETPKPANPPADTPAAAVPSIPTPAPVQPPPIQPSAPVEAMNNVPPPPVAAPDVPPAKVLPPPVAIPPPPPVRSQAEIASLLTAGLPSIPCSLARVATVPGGLALTGLAGAGDPAAALRKTAAAADPAGVAWQVRSVDAHYCSTLDLLRGVPETPSASVSLEQEGGAVPLVDNQVIGLRVTMPGFGGYLHMAYVQSNATVSPLVPSADYPAQTYPARTSIQLGQPRGAFVGWRAGPPFGTDMVVAVVSSAPLFARPPTDDQPLDTYLAALGTAIQTIRRQGGSVTATATIIETKPAPAAPSR